MAELKLLQRGQMPRAGQDCVLVEGVGSGGYLIHTNTTAANGRPASSAFQGPFILVSALDRAQALAKEMRLNTIFAIGLPNADEH